MAKLCLPLDDSPKYLLHAYFTTTVANPRDNTSLLDYSPTPRYIPLMGKPSLDFVFFIGKGGCGKDTQANLLLKNLDHSVKISTGELYRGAKEGVGEFAKYHSILEPYIANVDSGGYIPDELIVDIVKSEILEKTDKGINTFLFTGFPRTVIQLNLVDDMFIEMSGKFDIHEKYVYYPVSDELTRERSEMRNKLALEQGLQPRDDDRSESVEKKLKSFHKLTRPLIERLAIEDRIIVIKAERTIPEIEAETSQIFSKERV